MPKPCNTVNRSWSQLAAILPAASGLVLVTFFFLVLAFSL
jgi:hypothetical protein